MHYKLCSGIIIKSENAAKPHTQRSAFLQNLLTQLPTVESSFDYGCGKLRYLAPLLETSDTLALVDSEVQLSRPQRLLNRQTTIRNIARASNCLRAFDVSEFEMSPDRFDRGFCINVLSVIPFFAERRRTLERIRSKLRKGGRCLFVVQYRNSDFFRMRGMPNARLWRDGFLLDSRRGYSFYGLIAPDRLVSMLRAAQFAVDDLKINQGSAYVWASRQ